MPERRLAYTPFDKLHKPVVFHHRRVYCPQMLAEQFMRLPAVQEHIGLRRTKIYDLVRSKLFPAPVKLGRVSVWRRTEVAAWMNDRINESPAS